MTTIQDSVQPPFLPSFDRAPEVNSSEPEHISTGGMFDLLLRGQKRLSELLVNERILAASIQKLVVLSLAGFGVHGFVVGMAQQWAGSGETYPILWMPLAFAAAFLGALCVCIPSFYFYTQLAGFDASFRLVTAQALRANATTSVLLLGIAPFFAAFALACGLGYIDGGAQTMTEMGFVLPFVTGLVGVRALYLSFRDLIAVLPQTHERRGNILTRMVLCWGAIYSVIAPVALWRLSELLPMLVQRVLH